MIDYSRIPTKIIEQAPLKSIASFITGEEKNIDKKTVESFGEEWKEFSSFSEEEINNIGEEYFDIVEPHMLGLDKNVLDVGCGTGRWSIYLSDKVGHIDAIDPSDAVFSAVKLTEPYNNIRITQAGVDDLPFNNESFDFVFSLGVLHHIPDTQEAMKKAVDKLKKGGFFLVYLYYNLDNRSLLYKFIFTVSNIFRRLISSFPTRSKKISCEIIAIIIYLPLILIAKIVKIITPGVFYKKIPLSYYVGKSFNVIRNDALDRFGTPLEQRFTRKEITEMMESCGLSDLVFSEKMPCWHAVGKKSN